MRSQRKRSSGSLTVEEYVNDQCEQLVKRLHTRTDEMKAELRAKFEEQKAALLQAAARAATSAPTEAPVHKVFDVKFECTAGAYSGQTFVIKPRPHAPACKLGRSTGKTFVARGLSLALDEEISTTHAKVEVVVGLGKAAEKPKPRKGKGRAAAQGAPEEEGPAEAEDATPRIMFSDCNSTNGTLVDGVTLEPASPVQMVDGMVIQMGQCVFKISLVEAAPGEE